MTKTLILFSFLFGCFFIPELALASGPVVVDIPVTDQLAQLAKGHEGILAIGAAILSIVALITVFGLMFRMGR